MGAGLDDERIAIDLDVVSTGPDEAANRALWTPSRRRMAIGAAVVAAASVLAADTADAVHGPALPVTLTVPGWSVAVVDDTLYARVDGGNKLNAYSLRTGRQRWSVTVPNTDDPDLVPQATEPGLFEAGPYLLLTRRPGVRGVIALDAGTGAIRWQRPDSLVWASPSGDRVVLVTMEPVADPATPAGSGPSAGQDRLPTAVYSVVTTANGTDTAVFRAGVTDPSVVLSPDSDYWATGVFIRDDADGGRLFDFATAGTRRFDLPQPTPPASQRGTGGQSSFETLLIAGDVTVRTSQWGGRSTTTGYSGSPPRALWSIDDLDLYVAGWCGAALCGWNGAEAVALDPGTGTVRWRFPGGRLWRASEHRLYATYPAGPENNIGITVLDETTGHRFLRQDAWRPVALTEGPRVPITAFAPVGQVLAILDAQRLTARRLVTLPGGRADCRASRTHVVCRVGKDTFRAWEYSS